MQKDKLTKTAVNVINLYAPERNLTESDIAHAEGRIEETKQGDMMFGVREILIYPTKEGQEKMRMKTDSNEENGTLRPLFNGEEDILCALFGL